MARRFETVGVVGLGTMGAGIAEVFARAGLRVIGVEADEEALARGRGHLGDSLAKAVAKGKLTEAARAAIDDRLRLTVDRHELAGADLVVEAIPEIMDLKRALFQDLDRICKPDAILATNTSSLSVTEIAAITARPGLVVGMHFFNPAPIMRLVEVVSTVITADGLAADIAALARDLGKSPVMVGDRAGFVANRLLLPYLNQAAAMLDAGVAARDDIDAAIKIGLGLPMGPLTLLDLIGLDTAYEICEVLFRETRSLRHAPSSLLREYAAAGLLGRKTGRGFYTYGTAGEAAGMSRTTPAPANVKSVGIVGSGEQARTLITECAAAGASVTFAARGTEEVSSVLGSIGEVEGVTGVTDISELAGADVLVEAVGNERVAERIVVRSLDEIAADGTVVVTMVASVPVVELTSGLSRPSRLLGLRLHPGIAEVASTIVADDDASRVVRDLMAALGRRPVPCRDRAGFVVGALIYPYLNDAVRMYESGYASIADIDAAMKLGCGYPAGPFEMLDSIGLERVRDGLRALYAEDRDPAYAPAPMLDQLVTAGVRSIRTHGAA